MNVSVEKFLSKSAEKAQDTDHRNIINHNISKYSQSFNKGIKQYKDLELAKKRSKHIKWKAIEDLDQTLLKFETNFTNNGGNVIWAKDSNDAIAEIKKLIAKCQAKSIVKSKSMTTEEIELNKELEDINIEVNETDLGEFIVQLANEPPYHIVTPAMHKSKEDIASLFHDNFNTPKHASPEEITAFARKKLREKFLTAEIGITGANFILAEEGAISITENEGNARLTTACPKIHIVIVGIEKVISSFKDLTHFLPLLSSYGTGQKITAYNSIFFGPKKENEHDGPEEMHVIILDNGRTELLADKDLRESLYCIRCGACLNACPVYKKIGGHSYGTTYSGPIGSVISPHFKGMKEFNHLSFASSLCGNCTEVCPVRINIHELLMKNRKKAIDQGYSSISERWLIYLWKKANLKRSLLNLLPYRIKNIAFNLFFSSSWSKKRKDLKFSKKPFNTLWKEQFK